MPTTYRAAAVTLAALLATTACGSGAHQDSPAAVVEALYTTIAEGDYAGTCALVDAELKDAIEQLGSDCESTLEGVYGKDGKKAFADVSVDPDKIESDGREDGDQVIVPAEAITFGGKPSEEGGTVTVLRDGKWFVSDDAS